MHKIYICPLEKLNETLATSAAQNLLCLTSYEQKITQPKQIKNFSHLIFNDISSPQDELIAPQPQHIKKIIDFFCSTSTPTIICCWFGISRSSAAASIACATLFPELPSTAIATKLRSAAPFANPNPLMIELADKELKKNGELINAFENLAAPQQVSIGTPYILYLET